MAAIWYAETEITKALLTDWQLSNVLWRYLMKERNGKISLMKKSVDRSILKLTLSDVRLIEGWAGRKIRQVHKYNSRFSWSPIHYSLNLRFFLIRLWNCKNLDRQIVMRLHISAVYIEEISPNFPVQISRSEVTTEHFLNCWFVLQKQSPNSVL